MKKLSNILESAWGDMRHRGSGKSLRKEDEAIINFGPAEMYDYLKETYKDKVYWMDGDRNSCIEDKCIGIDPVEGISVYFEYGDDDKLSIIGMFYTITSFSEDPKEYPEFFKKLSNEFKVSVHIDKPEFSKQWEIRSKSGELTNKTIIDVIEFFLNTEINESAWGDMRHRGSGKSIRKEDDIESLDRDEMYDYIYTIYEQNPDIHARALKSRLASGDLYYSIPLFIFNMALYRFNAEYKNGKISKVILYALKVECEGFYDKLEERFKLYGNQNGPIEIKGKDDTVSNQLVLDFIDTVIEYAERPVLKKRDI